MKRGQEIAKVLCGNFQRAPREAPGAPAGVGEWRIAVQCSIGREITKVVIVTVPGDTYGRERALVLAMEKAVYPTIGVPGVRVMAACMASDAILEPRKDGTS